MASLKIIEEFLEQPAIALAGVSRSKNKFGNYCFKELKKKGFNVIPVNPHLSTYENEKCYPSFKDLPVKVNSALIMISSEKALDAVKDAFEAGINYIWLQQGIKSAEAIDFCRKNNINYISNECVMMFAKPEAMHKFHGWINKLIKIYPN
jgi:uncharacterized protein